MVGLYFDSKTGGCMVRVGLDHTLAERSKGGYRGNENQRQVIFG